MPRRRHLVPPVGLVLALALTAAAAAAPQHDELTAAIDRLIAADKRALILRLIHRSPTSHRRPGLLQVAIEPLHDALTVP
jgi:hypothetical protein